MSQISTGAYLSLPPEATQILTARDLLGLLLLSLVKLFTYLTSYSLVVALGESSALREEGGAPENLGMLTQMPGGGFL